MAMPTFTLTELFEAGVHFGHRTHRWNPHMGQYIFGSRNGIHIIDLQQTVPMLNTALHALRNIVAGNGRVLFVGTKRQAQDIVQESAERCGQFYVNHRWLGGTLTNWKTISKSITRLKELEEDFAADAELKEKLANAEEGEQVAMTKRQQAFANRTKKEKLMLTREFEKLQRVLGGIKNMGGLPDAVIVFDVRRDRLAVHEAAHLGIPVFAILDTNSDPAEVDYAIPGNDDSSRSLRLYARLFADSVLDGIESQTTSGRSEAAAKTAVKPKTDAETTVKLSPKAAAAAEAASENTEDEAGSGDAKPTATAEKTEAKAAASA